MCGANTNVRYGPIADIVTPLTFRTFCAGNDAGGDPWLQQLEARSEAKRVERLEQIVAALLEMRPTLIVDWNDHGVGKSLRGFDGIVGVHRKMKGARVCAEPQTIRRHWP